MHNAINIYVHVLKRSGDIKTQQKSKELSNRQDELDSNKYLIIANKVMQIR